MGKKYRLISLIILSSSMLIRIYSQNKEWNDISITEIGRESPHASFIYYADRESAKSYKPQLLSYYQSLNGMWKFKHAPEDYNPVGFYLHEFEIPPHLRGKQIFIHFAGVNAAFYIWINGKFTGYSEDSKTTA